MWIMTEKIIRIEVCVFNWDIIFFMGLSMCVMLPLR